MCDSSIFGHAQSYGSFFDDSIATDSGIHMPVTPNLNDVDDSDKQYIKDAYHSVPSIKRQFRIEKLVGEGTFSKVFLAKRLPGGTAVLLLAGDKSDDEVALKFIKPNISPARVRFELECLLKLSDSVNVIDIIQCERHMDQVVFTMPFIQHHKLNDILDHMSLSDVREYMRHLLLALMACHELGIIHRDIKAGNFLYHHQPHTPPTTQHRQYKLVDFGLAQLEGSPPKVATHRPANTKVNGSKQPQRRPLSPRQIATSNVSRDRDRVSHLKRDGKGSVDTSVSGSLNDSLFVRRGASSSRHVKTYSARPGRRTGQTGVGGGSSSRVVSRGVLSVCNCMNRSAVCGRAAQVCKLCMDRPPQQAARAGTPGFRAPEVLMKYEHQTTGVGDQLEARTGPWTLPRTASGPCSDAWLVRD